MANKTVSKTLRLTKEQVDSIEKLALKNNRNFNNMAETLMLIGIKHYKSF